MSANFKTATMKVLVYWPQERQWSIVSESAVQEDVLPGQRTKVKFQGKLYPSLIVAKDNQEAIVKIEASFKEYINSCLMEEAPDDVEECIVQYINGTVNKSKGSITQKITKVDVTKSIDAVTKTKQKKKQLDNEKLQAKKLQLDEIITARKSLQPSTSSPSMPVAAQPSQQNRVLVSMPSESSLPSETPLPTKTPLPSETPLPTKTPLPSVTPLPSETPLPTKTPPLQTPYYMSVPSDKSRLELKNEQLKHENGQLRAENEALKQQIADNSLPVTPRKLTFLKNLATRLEIEQSISQTPEQPFKRHCQKSILTSPVRSTLATSNSTASSSPLISECSDLTSSPEHYGLTSPECSSLGEWDKTVTENGVKKVLLMKGFNVYISQAKLSTALVVGTCPRKLVIQLLECFFSREQLSVSNASGKRHAHNASTQTKPLNKLVVQAIFEFILVKFKLESGEPALTVTSFNSIINSKCATARRGLKL